MRLISYWLLPVISGVMWLVMLLVMLLYWIYGTDEERYSSMSEHQTIAYISDIGADTLRPYFIVGCVLTALFLDLSFVADRWLRHRGRLVPNVSLGEYILMGLTIAFALVGTAGLVGLSVADTVHHESLHRIFLFVFIAGYLLSAVFICWEYQRLGKKHREHRILRVSFWIKLVFILVELALAIAFGVFLGRDPNTAAVLEWIVAFIFSFYVFSFALDLWPAVHTKDPAMRFVKAGAAPSLPGSTSSAAEMGEAYTTRELATAEAGAAEYNAAGSTPGSTPGRGNNLVPGQEYPRYMERQPAQNY